MDFKDIQTMKTDDAPIAKFAQVFVTKGTKRYAMLMCKDFEGKANISTQDVPRMGSVVMGKKPTSVELSFTMTIYKCTEIFDEIIEEFIQTGVMPRIDIQTSNNDPSSSIGTSQKVYNNCILDGNVLLSLAGSEDDFIEQEISGFAESVTRPEKYTNPSYMASQSKS